MSVAKSIRIPEEIYYYIMDYNGDGFNQKFINIIRDARDTEEERNATLSILEHQIKSRREYLQKTEQKLQEMSRTVYSMYNDMQYGIH